ncbi:unnamed protein product [Anisakis simplex]|uniref:Uncharacterized protein n=1 Tax=Anisakis simplex TaxID=6269 RepID=A0A0M3J906_ANISI|nr:unnamed protein product [Anisakis simplex]
MQALIVDEYNPIASRIRSRIASSVIVDAQTMFTDVFVAASWVDTSESVIFPTSQEEIAVLVSIRRNGLEEQQQQQQGGEPEE